MSGGAEMYCHEIGKRLVKKGYKVYFLSSKFKGSKSHVLVDGVRIHRIGNKLTFYLLGGIFSLKYTNKVKFVLESISPLPHFSRWFLNRDNVAMIHHISPPWAIRRKLKLLTFFDFTYPIIYFAQYFLIPLLYKKYTIITNSKEANDFFSSKGFKNTHLLRTGTDIPELNEAKTDLVVFPGPLKSWKRPEDAIFAFVSAPENWKMIMFGAADSKIYIDQLHSLLKKYRLEDRVTILGRVSDKEKWSYFKRSKIAIVSSVYEGWGLSALEAQASGCVILGYNVPGINRCVVDGETGILVEDGNKDKLRMNLGQITRNHVKLEVLSKKALAHASFYSWNNAMEDFESILNI
jgi:glycosyltransferase involved in cell wall biosynthesis